MNQVWNFCKLGEVCEMIKRGVAPKYIEEGGICVLNQKCVRDHKVNYALSRRHNIDLKKINKERYVQVGDVLVNSTGTGTLGRVAQIRTEPKELTTVDTHVTIVRPKKDIFYPEFFGYMLIKIEDEITSSGEGASGQTELSRTKLEQQFGVSYPDSLSEQKRIVAILDEAFAAIDQAIANTEKSIQNARELFESYRSNIFESKRGKWVFKKLGKLTEVQSGGTPSKGKREYWDGSIAWYSSGELNEDLTKKPKRNITKSGLENSNTKLFPEGSLLIGMYDTAALKMSILDREAAFNQAISGAKPSASLELRFVMHAINFQKAEILMLRRGVRQKNLNLKKIKNISVPYPPVSEQRAVAEEISLVENMVSVFVANCEKKILALNELKQSILQKAFTGELTSKPEELLQQAAV